jgi:outer membrane protein OmpA-like peptidoglycan-associated protein
LANSSDDNAFAFDVGAALSNDDKKKGKDQKGKGTKKATDIQSTSELLASNETENLDQPSSHRALGLTSSTPSLVANNGTTVSRSRSAAVGKNSQPTADFNRTGTATSTSPDKATSLSSQGKDGKTKDLSDSNGTDTQKSSPRALGQTSTSPSLVANNGTAVSRSKSAAVGKNSQPTADFNRTGTTSTSSDMVSLSSSKGESGKAQDLSGNKTTASTSQQASPRALGQTSTSPSLVANTGTSISRTHSAAVGKNSQPTADFNRTGTTTGTTSDPVSSPFSHGKNNTAKDLITGKTQVDSSQGSSPRALGQTSTSPSLVANNGTAISRSKSAAIGKNSQPTADFNRTGTATSTSPDKADSRTPIASSVQGSSPRALGQTSQSPSLVANNGTAVSRSKSAAVGKNSQPTADFKRTGTSTNSTSVTTSDPTMKTGQTQVQVVRKTPVGSDQKSLQNLGQTRVSKSNSIAIAKNSKHVAAINQAKTTSATSPGVGASSSLKGTNATPQDLLISKKIGITDHKSSSRTLEQIPQSPRFVANKGTVVIGSAVSKSSNLSQSTMAPMTGIVIAGTTLPLDASSNGRLAPTTQASTNLNESSDNVQPETVPQSITDVAAITPSNSNSTTVKKKRIGRASPNQGDDGLGKPEIHDIFFDYDKSALTKKDIAILKADAAVMKLNPNLRIVLAGHTDERGSNQYNFVLGEKRSLSTLKYLIKLGVPQKSITQVKSYGKQSLPDKKLCVAHGEACWKLNRVVHLMIFGHIKTTSVKLKGYDQRE